MMENSEEYFQKKIVVIGAGVSGLACASHLRDYGFENILILEARDRIGGRTHTINHPLNENSEETEQGFLEFGAQWIHGQENNVVYELAHSKGLINESAPNYYDAITSFDLLHSEEEANLIKALLEHLDSATDEITKDMEEDINLSDFLDKAFSKFIIEYDDLEQVELLKGAYDWYRKLQCELNGCTDLSCVSTRLLNHYQDCDGLQTVELKFGYSSILNLLYQKIPEESICLENTVEKIDWSDFKTDLSNNDKRNCNLTPCYKENKDLKIKIFCTNGEIYEADHVIITVPLGFLKEHFNSFFVPALSENKIKAIQSVGFGTVNKIFLEFSDPFWEPPALYNVIWNKSYDEIFLGNNESSKVWIKYINRFAYTPGHRNVLCAWIVGQGAISMENLSAEEVSDHCMELLEKITGHKLPKPKSILRSKWCSDPQAHGSYSFLSMDSDSDSIPQIAEPEVSNVFCSLHPVLQFAGEATHPFHYSTVHGAYETGLREAQRLFKHYRDSLLNHPSFVYLQARPSEDTHFHKLFCENLKILIVGAGLAGLATASSLYEKGFSNIVVLEAQEDVGGRIFSLPLGNNFVELGAQWIHGADNPLYEFSLNNHLLCDPSDEPSSEARGLFCTSDGKVIEVALVEEILDFLLNTKNNLCDGLFNNRPASLSVQTLFTESFRTYLENYNNDSLNSIREALFSWFLKVEIIDNSCDSLDEVAVQCYTEWCDIPDEEYHINFTNSFRSVIDTLNSQLPPGSLHLKIPVKTIHWKKKYECQYLENFWRPRSQDSYPILVECENGENYTADIVVMTASTGYIKENMNSLFNPVLPDNKTKAFNNIGFGTINKIFLVYEISFWKPQDKGFQLIWTADIDEELRCILENHPWVNGITGFDVVRKQPNVLLGWIGGKEAKMMESIDIEIVSNICTNLLRKFLNSPDIPMPLKIFRSCWYGNKYIRGAYSYRSLNFHLNDSKSEDLQSPLYMNYEHYENEDETKFQWPAVYFAGEAMDENCFSSAHGAFQSGLKVADSIDMIYSQIKDLINGSCDK